MKTNDPLINDFTKLEKRYRDENIIIWFRWVRFAYAWVFETMPTYPTLEFAIDLESKHMARTNWNFVTIRLQKSDKKGLETWAESIDHDLQTLYDFACDDNLKMTLTYSEKQSSWCFTLTRGDADKHQKNTSMTSWSDDPIEAQYMGFYKHVVISQRGEWVGEDNSQVWG